MLSRVAMQTARRASSLLSRNVTRSSPRTFVVTSRSGAVEGMTQMSSFRNFHGAMGPLNMPVKLVEVSF